MIDFERFHEKERNQPGVLLFSRQPPTLSLTSRGDVHAEFILRCLDSDLLREDVLRCDIRNEGSEGSSKPPLLSPKSKN